MPEVGRVVLALSGKEAGRLCVIVAASDAGCFIADGRHRKLQNPKRKNPRHLRCTALTLAPEQYATDRHLRRTLQQAGHRNDDNQS